MRRYWAAGFPPDSWTQTLERFWPWERLISLLGQGAPGEQAALGYLLPTLYAVLALVGIGVLWVQHRRVCLLLTAPLGVTIGAAVAGQYPFSDRLILFLLPTVFIAIAATIDAVWQLTRPRSVVIASALAVAMLTPAVYPVAITPPAYLNEHMKPMLARLQADRRPGDGIYVYYGAAPVVAFYAHDFGLERREYFVGACHRGDSRQYLQEVDTFRGQSRVWVLITHSISTYREREDILGYLDAIGARRAAYVVASRAVGRQPLPAEAFLYDLSDAEQASTASAATFSLTGSASVESRLSCVDRPQAGVTPNVP
jgi:hypothetical protein